MNPVPANYCIIRSVGAGVFAGEVLAKDLAKGVVEITNARRLYFWAGAATLSQLAMEGVEKPKQCKFSVPTFHHTVLGVVEIIPVTQKAFESIASVNEWRAS